MYSLLLISNFPEIGENKSNFFQSIAQTEQIQPVFFMKYKMGFNGLHPESISLMIKQSAIYLMLNCYHWRPVFEAAERKLICLPVCEGLQCETIASHFCERHLHRLYFLAFPFFIHLHHLGVFIFKNENLPHGN